MSEKLSIQEAGKSRNFSGVGVIETETPEGNSCFWVPESERELESELIVKNGDYKPKKYAFSELNVNIIELIGDYKITIDDYDLPHIDLDGIDITIDETGIPHINFDYEIVTVDDETIKVIYPDDKEVIIHGPDLDSLINIDDVFTIDYDKETGTWTITAIVDVTSGDNEFAPGDIVAQWPGTEHVDIHIGQSISIPDLGDIDLDFDADIDVSIDVDLDGDINLDLVGVNLNGDDININIDLDDLDIDIEDCPEEIRVMHVPSKTEYKDGQAIDYDGLVVQAFDSDGNPWNSSEYPDGYIPAHKLNLPQYADITETTEHIIIPEYDPNISEIDSVTPTTIIADIASEHFPDWLPEDNSIEEQMKSAIIDQTGSLNAVCYSWCNGIPESEGSFATNKWMGVVVFENLPSIIVPGRTYSAKHYIWGFYYLSGSKQSSVTFTGVFNINYPIYAGVDPNDKEGKISNINLSVGNTQEVSVSFTSPCLNNLTASFDITVEENDGTAQSNEESSGGQWGGTTISGNYGGSHHSGKF